MQEIFYNSSLPRSGSTLLQNILAQNPEFYCSPTSGVSQLISACVRQFNHGDAWKAQGHNAMTPHFLSFCKGGIFTYYSSLTKKKYIVDKSRSWTQQYALLKKLDPNLKVVCMVRDLRSVFASLEKKVRQNPERENWVTNVGELKGLTVESRVQQWSKVVPIGPPVNFLMNAIETGYAENILFIKYEDLVKKPEREIKKVYKYFGAEFYPEHDFKNITQLTHENDTIFGIYGDHQLRGELKELPQDYEKVLGKTISDNIKKSYKWFYDYFKYK